jgi:hypothetical protein
MDYLCYYLATLFMTAGITGFVMGGAWVWLGASTFLLALVLNLLAQAPDHATRQIHHPVLADIPLYLNVTLLALLVAAAAWRVHVSAVAGVPLGITGLAGIVVTLAWLGVLPISRWRTNWRTERSRSSTSSPFFAQWSSPSLLSSIGCTVLVWLL